MGIFDVSDDVQEEQEETDDDEASVSYIYVYEEGREERGKYTDYDEDAYRYAASGGTVRQFAKSPSCPYSDIHELMSHIVGGLGRTIESGGDFSHLLEEIEPDAEGIAKYLDQNEEIQKELLQRLKSMKDAEEAEQEAEEQ